MLTQGYARIYRANAVLTASPGQLVLMLYDGALRALALTREAFQRPDSDVARLQVINHQLLKAQAILSELQGGLNYEAGGEVAHNLNRVYDYYKRRLFEANLRKQAAPVAEVEQLLGEVRGAWAEMLAKQSGSVPATEPVRGAA